MLSESCAHGRPSRASGLAFAHSLFFRTATNSSSCAHVESTTLGAHSVCMTPGFPSASEKV